MKLVGISAGAERKTGPGLEFGALELAESAVVAQVGETVASVGESC